MHSPDRTRRRNRKRAGLQGLALLLCLGLAPGVNAAAQATEELELQNSPTVRPVPAPTPGQALAPGSSQDAGRGPAQNPTLAPAGPTGPTGPGGRQTVIIENHSSLSAPAGTPTSGDPAVAPASPAPTVPAPEPGEAPDTLIVLPERQTSLPPEPAAPDGKDPDAPPRPEAATRPAQESGRAEETPVPQPAGQIRQAGQAGNSAGEQPVTLESFLVKTPEASADTPGETGKNATLKKAAAAEEPPARPAAKPEKPKRDKPAAKPEAPKPDKQPEAKKPAKGQPLTIPEQAKKTGDVGFLEGCWVGTRPEYYTKRIIRERFCFDEKGVGKRFISDPAYAGECVGATRALLNANGVLRMQSEQMYCTKISDKWGSAEMTCRGEGDETPCTWQFRDAGGGRQSYTIRFVRE